MIEKSHEEEFADLRQSMKAAIDTDVARYDQNLAGYKDLMHEYLKVADIAFHNLGEDLVVPAVGAVIRQTAEDAEKALGSDKVIFDLAVILSCAIAEIIHRDHATVGVKE